MHPLIRDVQKGSLKSLPEIQSGYTVRVHQRIKEGGKERVQVFEGLVIAIGHGEGVEQMFTVRKVVDGVGVEKVFPLHSPVLVKIEVKKKSRVRRAKLYYMRRRSGKSARLQAEMVPEERIHKDAGREALIEEAMQAQAKKEKVEAQAEKAATS